MSDEPDTSDIPELDEAWFKRARLERRSVTEQWLVWSNEHRAWWGPGRHGYTTLTDRAGRYSLDEATAICAQANIVPRDPPNEVAVLAPRPIRTGGGHPYDPTEPKPIWDQGDD